MADFRFSLRKDISLIEPPGGAEVILQTTDRRVTFRRVTLGTRAALSALAAEGATAEQLDRLAQSADGQLASPGFHRPLQQLCERGLICRSVLSDKELIATAVPRTADGQFQAGEVFPQRKYALSRFAYVHTVAGQMVLESPLSHAKVILHHWLGAALVATLAQAQTYGEAAALLPAMSEDTIKLLFDLLLSVNMLTRLQENGPVEDAENPALAQWEFHDLLFHSRSRRGRHADPTGNTLRFKGQIEPLPVLKPPMSYETIPLYRPDLKAVIAADAPFSQVLEERRSLRTYGDIPITLQQLGEFLYRSARVRSILQTELGELTDRPYPNGGAMYELEIYLAVNACAGLPSGLYHYQPDTHQLYRLAAEKRDIETLLKDAAWRSMGQAEWPQVLLIMAARFQRVAWKYEGIAYSLILKNVGVLQQTMHLVATAMGLAACALGGGDSDLFARAAGTDYYAETSVGEFALGSQS